MNKPKRLSALSLTLSLILAAGLPGCATFEKCSPENCATDAKIKADVSAMFAAHPEFGAAAEIHIQTINGVVYLNGTVDTELEVRSAESLTRGIDKVKEVVNNLNARSNGR
jgi:osmotically-inducible protein OsmY